MGWSKNDKTLLEGEKTVKLTQSDRTTQRDGFGFDTSSGKSSILKRFRDYEIVSELPATGGEADLYVVEKNGETFMLKLYRKGINPKLNVLKKIESLSKKYPEQLVLVYESGFESTLERYYELMEYIRNGNLRNFQSTFTNLKGQEKEKTLEKIIENMSEALHILHEEGIIHRDLKPENILVKQQRPLTLVLGDFGISLETHEDISNVYTSTFKGTLTYMAPEEKSGYFGPEIDWWHLGLILYELLVGKNPFEGMQPALIMNLLSTKQIDIPASIDEKYSQLLRGLLTRDPERRWVYDEIKKWLKGERDIPIHYEYDERIDPKNIDEWFKEGFDERAARVFLDAKFSMKDAKRYRNTFLREQNDIDEDAIISWIEAGFIDPFNAIKWHKSGFDPYEAKVFEELGISVTDALTLKELGLTAYELKKSVEKAGKKPEQINVKRLIEEVSSGFKPFELEKWERQGFSKKEAKEWKSVVYDYDEASEWLSKGFTLEQVGKWRDCGFKPEIAKLWAEKGFEPNEAKRWRAPEFNVNEAKLWKEKGFQAQDACLWKNSGFNYITAKPWKEAGINNPTVAKAWKEQGFAPDESLAWFKAGFNPEDAEKWSMYGYTPDSALDWKTNNFQPGEVNIWRSSGLKPSEARSWHENRFSPLEAQRWIKVKILNPTEANEWKRFQFSPEDAAMWKERGFTPSEARNWKYAHFKPREAYEWKEQGFKPDSARKWENVYEFTPQEAKEWAEFIFEPQEAVLWKRQGFNPKEAYEWKENKFTLDDIILILKWKSLGFDPEETRKWIDQGFEAEEAKLWKENSIRPEMAREWINFGFSLEQAAILNKRGFIPPEAKRWQKYGFDLVKEILQSDSRRVERFGSEIIEKVAAANNVDYEEIKENTAKKLEELSPEAKKLLSNLDDHEKIEAILCDANKAIVIAGPGSGKTNLIAYKVAYLLLNGVKESEILLVTFTNKAADELTERLERLLNRELTGITCGTFHHIFNLFTKQYYRERGIDKDRKILDNEEPETLMQHAINMLNNYRDFEDYPIDIDTIEGKTYTKEAAFFYKIHSYSRNTLSSLRFSLNKMEKGVLIHNVEIVNRIIEEYEKLKRFQNSLDFDDIMLEMINILTTKNDFRRKISKKYKWIFIDEFQDTNVVQLKFIDLISTDENHIFAIADDAQSIYSFRGARFENMLDFLIDAELFIIRTNYRSSEPIVELINILLPEGCIPKPLKAKNPSTQKPCIVEYRGIVNYKKNKRSNDKLMVKLAELENSFIIEKIKKYTRSGYAELDEIGVLYRSRYMLKPLELALQFEQIPYETQDNRNITAEPPISDIKAFLSLFNNPREIQHWYKLFRFLGITNVPRSEFVNRILRTPDPIDTFLGLEFSEPINENEKNLKQAFKEALSYASPYHRLVVFYERFYKKVYQRALNLDAEELSQIPIIVEELINFSKQFLTVDEFLKKISKDSISEPKVIEQSGVKKLTLSTIHQAKGLEWKIVFLMGVVPGHFPHSKSDVSEEERLFYVAVSRAKEKLFIIRSPQLSPSANKEDFIEKIPPELVEYEFFQEVKN